MNRMKNKFSPTFEKGVANIVPAVQSLKVEEMAWLLV